jgi:hypothetical protein
MFFGKAGRGERGGDILQQSQKYDGNQKNHAMAFVSITDDIRFEAVLHTLLIPFLCVE